MNCSCVYVNIDGNIDTHTEKIVKARKQHTCCECDKIIEINEKYEYIKGFWEGDVVIYKTCLDCLSIRYVFFCDGWYYTQTKELLRDHIYDIRGDVSEDCLVDLTPKAREDVCEMIEKVWRK